MKIGQRRDQAGNNAGLANASGMAANDDDGHTVVLGSQFSVSQRRESLRAARDKYANSLRYSRIGRAGVPQKTTPFPRITFLDGMPLCAPRIAPSSMRT